MCWEANLRLLVALKVGGGRIIGGGGRKGDEWVTSRASINLMGEIAPSMSKGILRNILKKSSGLTKVSSFHWLWWTGLNTMHQLKPHCSIKVQHKCPAFRIFALTEFVYLINSLPLATWYMHTHSYVPLFLHPFLSLLLPKYITSHFIALNFICYTFSRSINPFPCSYNLSLCCSRFRILPSFVSFVNLGIVDCIPKSWSI